MAEPRGTKYPGRPRSRVAPSGRWACSKSCRLCAASSQA